MLRNVLQQPYYVLKEWAHIDTLVIGLHRHDQILHDMDDLGEALEVFEGRTRVHLVPVD